MVRRTVLLILVSFILMPLAHSFAQEASQQEVTQQEATQQEAAQQPAVPLFIVERFVIAGSIENLEPVGIVDAFSSATERVFCFLEARDISADTSVSFVWSHGDKVMARVDLPIKAGKRWRTYSSKKLGGQKGEWKVELQDSAGMVLKTLTFTVE